MNKQAGYEDSKGYIEVPNPYVPDKPTRFVEFNQEALGLLNVRSQLSGFIGAVANGGQPVKPEDESEGGEAEREVDPQIA